MAKLLTPTLQKFLKVFFQNLYTRFAFLYDAVAWLSSMGQWNKWVRTAQINFEPGLILEIGHGPGHLMVEMNQAKVSIIGLDPSRSMNRMAYHRLQSAGYAADIVRGIAQALPFADGNFRAIISTFPSDYIVDPETLAEVHRVLAMEGILIIVGLVEITGTSIPDRFARWLYTITGQSGPAPHGWEEFLLEHGFEPKLEEVILHRSRVTRLVATRK
jgi:ubiquinone/menaquinone biosynthesis C-methylase UbiE